MDSALIHRLCTQLDRLEGRFNDHALEEASRDAELLAEVRAIRSDFGTHKHNHRKWETRMWGLAASVVGFFGFKGWQWLAGR